MRVDKVWLPHFLSHPSTLCLSPPICKTEPCLSCLKILERSEGAKGCRCPAGMPAPVPPLLPSAGVFGWMLPPKDVYTLTPASREQIYLAGAEDRAVGAAILGREFTLAYPGGFTVFTGSL